jgi:predicted methyltransferase
MENVRPRIKHVPRSFSMKPHHLSWFKSHRLVTAAILVSAAAALCECQRRKDPPLPTEQYRALVASPIAPTATGQLDARRHPVELLQFAQVRPALQVLDVAAGGGYTSQLLALAVGPSGKLWAQTPNPSAALKERLAANPQTGIAVTTRPFDDRCRRKQPAGPGDPDPQTTTTSATCRSIATR